MRMIDRMPRPFTILRSFGLLLCSVLCTSGLRGQENEASNTAQELWTGAGVKYKFLPRYSIQLHHEQRFRTEGFVLDKNFTELELKRKWKNGLSLAGGLRYIQNNDTEGKVTGIEERYRWQADLGYKFDIERFSIGTRVRFQSRREFEGNGLIVNALRWKLALGYNIRKWKLDPKLSTELFKRNDKQESITKMRLTLGTDYSMGEWGRLRLFYRMEEDLTANEPLTKGIWALRYRYAL